MRNIEYLFSNEEVPYPQSVDFMQRRVAAILAGDAPSCIWFLEHPALYTAGRSAKPEELLQQHNLPIHQSERGGKYTYHGPGQRVIYLMLDLQKLFCGQPDVSIFVRLLEDWLASSLQILGIESFTRKGRVGIWVHDEMQQEAKIAAIGVRVRRWISFHGVALNLNPDLSHYNGIIPCGLQEYGVTSINRLKPEITMQQCDAALLEGFSKVFLNPQ